ncbi:MAG: DUF1284 domain-containing protein [Thermoanaerobacteraceae bacterium]|nr:DUF1284 domain-containing protein [Thermoanaerobacteraceae bacterium]
MSIKLRGHHLICLQFFQGKGYDRKFTDNLQELLQRIEAGEETILVNGPDDVCLSCPHLQAAKCMRKADAADEIKRMDEQACVYFGLTEGDIVKWQELRDRVNRIPSAWYARFCKECDWLDICNQLRERDRSI